MRYVLLVLLAALSVACATTLDPVPESPDVEIQYVDRDKPCIIGIQAVAPSTLPDYPPFDEADPAGWAKEVRRIHKVREAKKDAEIEALRFQIFEHNLLEPKC